MDAVLTSPWPFAVRDTELALLRSVLLDRSTDARAVAVVADAGVGKTRLLTEFTRTARSEGVSTVTLVGTTGSADTPYGALATLAPQLGLNATNPAALHQGVARHLTDTTGPPRVLVVDDAHLLDAGTAALVLHLATTRAVGVAVAIRHGAPAPAALTAMWRDEHAIRLDLTPFTHSQHEHILRQVLGAPVDARSLRQLAQVCGGNALYLRDLVRGAVASGALRTDHGVWSWDGRVVLAPALTDLIGNRLGRLDAADTESLALLALGEPVTLGLATQLVGPDCLARLEDAGLIDIKPLPDGNHVVLDHPLYGEVLLQRTGQLTRQRLLTRLADAFAAGPDATRHQLRVTGWRLAAGDTVPTDELIDGSYAAGLAFDFELAERLARAALPDGGPRGQIALAGALSGQGRFQQAEALLADSEAAVTGSTDHDLQFHYVHQRFLNLHRGLGVPGPLTAMLDELIATHSELPVGQLARGLRASMYVESGELAAARDVTTAVLTDPNAHPWTLMLCLENRAEVMAYCGRTDTARELHGQLRSLAAQHEVVRAQASATSLLQSAMCDLFDGHVDRAVVTLQGAYDQMLDHPDPVIRGLGAMLLGAALLRHGQLSSAILHLRDSVALRSARQSADSAAWALGLLSQAQALAGDSIGAEATLTEALDHQSPQPAARCHHDLVRARALVAAVSGRRSQAVQTCLDGADELAAFTLYRASILNLAVRLGAPPQPIAAELATLAPEVDSPLVALQARHAGALAARDAFGLAAVADDLAADGMWLEAGEAHLVASELHRAAGRRGEATRSASAATRLFDRCGLTRSPLVAVGEALPHLSRRELEIAGLAARGLSNADIAAELVVSVRTVESHLYNAFAKLGVTRRDELASVIGEDHALHLGH